MRMQTGLRRAVDAFFGPVLPLHCAGCGRPLVAGHLCSPCAESARKIAAPCCHVCSEPFFGEITDAFTCPNCEGREFAFNCAVAVYRSRGVVRKLIHAFKYQRHLHLRHVLGRWLADGFADERIACRAPDALVCVPLHAARQRERGFNQALEIAEIAAKHIGIPVFDCLSRIRHTTTQTHFDREERMENLRGAFRVRQNARVRNLSILLVDDVLTTGSTLHECARVLCEAGAASVRALTIARG